MVRTVAVVVAALLSLRPSVPAPAAQAWSKTIQKVAADRDIDPFTLLAIFWHESHLHPGVVSPDGEDFGLGQIRARYLKGCRRDMPAAKDMSASCMAVKARLMDPTYNIALVAKVITKKRAACREITGRSAKFHRWLAAYGGVTRSKGHRTTCGQRKVKGKWRDTARHPGVQAIIRCRNQLVKGQSCR